MSHPAERPDDPCAGGVSAAHVGMDWRVDPLTRKPTVIVGAGRVARTCPAAVCPFCPGGLEAPEATTT